MDLAKIVIGILEKIGALKTESFKGKILELITADKYDVVVESSLGVALHEELKRRYLCILVQKPDDTVVGVVPNNITSGKYAQGSEFRFEIYVGGWLLTGRVPLGSQEMSVTTDGGYVRQTVELYNGSLYPLPIKPNK